MTRITRAVLALLLTFGGAPSLALAQSPPTRDEILRRLARGEDVRELLSEYRAAHAADARSPLPPRSGETAELRAALEAFRGTLDELLRREPASADLATSSYESLRAADLLVRERFQTVAERLRVSGAAADITSRLETSERDYREVSDRLFVLLDPAMEALKKGQATSGFAEALREAREILATRLGRKDRPILRASVLPYRPARLAPRAPTTTPVVLPSYRDPSDVVPDGNDLGGSDEAVLTEEILKKAEALGYDYVRVFEFVRNEIQTEWYAGGMKGALGTLLTGSGNDVDQASLLVALLRASQAPARYVHGVIERPVEALADELRIAPAQVPAALARAGIAHRPVVRGGRVAAIELEHTWVSAHVPYTNYRGAVVDFSGKLWVPLAPAIKKYTHVPGTRILRKMSFSVGGEVVDYLSAPQPETPLVRVRSAVQSYLEQNTPPETPQDTYEAQLGSRAVVAERVGLLPSSLPVDVVAVTGESPALDAGHEQRVRFVVRAGPEESSAAILDETASLHELAGKRLTLSYQPATVDDHTTVNLFGGLDAVPLYLIRLRAQIDLAGRQLAVSRAPIDPGVAHRFDVEITGPFGTERVTQTVTSGSYYALSLTAQQEEPLSPDETNPGDSETLAAQLLSRIARGFSSRWGAAEGELAGLLDVAVLRPLPALSIVGNAVRIESAFGLPVELSFEGVNLDAALRVAEPIDRGDTDATREWMELSALHGSALERVVFEEDFLVESMSADRGLGQARQTGIEVLRITRENVGTALPTLNHPPEVKADVENWVRLGLLVDIPREEVSLNAWQGSVWRAFDASTGASGYFISGGLAGGTTTVPPSNWILDFLADALSAPYSAAPNTDPTAGVEIIKIGATDGQTGEVGKELGAKLAVLIRDEKGRPVQGAGVTFGVTHGEGKLVNPTNGQRGESVTVFTTELGIASAGFVSGESTDKNPIYIMKNEGDEFATQALSNLIEAFGQSKERPLVIDSPFEAIGMPGPPAALRFTNPPNGSGVPGTWADSLNVSVDDRFENPVSNASVDYNVASPIPFCDPPPPVQNAVVFDNTVTPSGGFKGCSVSQPILGDCGSSSLTKKTSVRGASAGVILGNSGGTDYFVSVNSSGLPRLFARYNGNGGCEIPPFVRVSTSFLSNDLGFNINATKVGRTFPGPIEATLFYSIPDFEVKLGDNGKFFIKYKSTLKWVRTTGGVSFSVSNGGSSSGATFIGDGTYQTFVTTGPTTGINEILIEAADVLVVVDVVNRDTGSVSKVQTTGTLPSRHLNDVTGVDVKFFGFEPPLIKLNRAGQTEAEASVTFKTEPPSYVSNSAEMNLFGDDEWAGHAVASRSGEGKVFIPRGFPFDVNKRYEVELVHNRGSLAEIKSDRLRVPLFQGIFANVRRFLSLTQDVDLLNRRICAFGSEFLFTLTQPAKITLKFKKIESVGAGGSFGFGSTTTLIENQDFPKGDQRFPITPADLVPGDYQFEVSGVSLLDGHTDTEIGLATYKLTTRDNLPIGHVIVEGVDLFDGHLILSRQDFDIPGRGVPLAFSRFYSSSSGEPGPLGAGWTHNYDSKVIVTACSEVIVIGGEGSGMRFVDDGGGGLKPLKGHHGSLVANRSDNSFDFYSKDGTRSHYEFSSRREWNLTSITDTNGNATKLLYDRSGASPKVISVTDPGGRSVSFEYQFKSFLTFSGDVVVAVRGPDGIALGFEYDGFGNLVRASRENASRVEGYSYSTPPTFPLEERHQLTAVTNALNGAVTRYEHKRASIGVGAGNADKFFVAKLTKPQGGEFRFEVDLAGLRNVAPQLTSRVTDPRAQVTTYTLNRYGSPLEIADAEGNRTLMTWAADDIVMESRTDGNGVQTTYAHDVHGNQTSETVTVADFDGASHVYRIETTYVSPQTFNPPYIKTRVRSRKNRNGAETSFVYDGRGNLTEERVAVSDVDGKSTTLATRHIFDGLGDRKSSTDPRRNTTFFSYDGFGNLTAATDPLRVQTTTTWDTRSRPRTQRDGLGRVTTLDYDTLDRRIRTAFPAVTGSPPATETMTYDDVGNRQIQTDAEGRRTTTTFDREARPVRVENALGGAKVLQYDLAGNKILESTWFDAGTPRLDTTFGYDRANRLTGRGEPLGRVTELVYDGAGNVTRETLRSSVDSSFLPRVVEYDYDGLNRKIRIKRQHDTHLVTAVVRYDGEGSKVFERDPLGREAFYRHDAVNRLIESREPEFQPGDPKITQMVYDENGNRLEARLFNKPETQIRRFAYDARNRPTRQVNAVGATTLFEYDAVSNLTREIDPRLNVTTYTYDARNRRTSASRHLTQVTTPGRVVTMSFAYDRANNLTEERLPNGNVVVHTYDGLNRRKGTADGEGPVSAHEYDARGNRIRETDANGNVTENDYDALDRLSEKRQPENRTLRFAYDVAGNRTSETDGRGFATTFRYDRLNRLVATKDTAPFGFTTELTYDDVGNKLTEKDRRGSLTEFQYDVLNRLVRVVDPPPFGFTQEFTYDAVGSRLTQKDRRGVLTENAYDRENRLVQVKRAGVVVTQVEYDQNGNRRFETDANRNIVGFEYDERNLLTAENRPLAAITRYKLDDMGDRIEERDPENRRILRVYDKRRRLTSETNGASEKTSYRYDGNGNRTASKPPKENEWSFDYDGANRLRLVTDPLGNATEYRHDANDNRILIIDAEQKRTGREYDALDRFEAMEYDDGAREEYEYDENGNRTEVRDPKQQVTSREYDVLNRESKKTYSATAEPTDDDIQSIETSYDPNGNPIVITESYSGATGTRVTRETYDDFDRMETVTDAQEKKIAYGYDANGNRTLLRDPDDKLTRYTFDALNRVGTVTPTGTGVTQYEYFRNGLLRRIAYPNGSEARYQYDSANRVTSIENRQNAALVSSFEYAYDPNGNRTKQVENQAGVEETTTYEYDRADRLETIHYPDKDTAYTLDGAGNRLTEQETNAGGTRVTDKSFTYDDRHRLTEITDNLDATKTITYAYDANGNQTGKTEAGVSTAFRFDIRDQLSSVVRGADVVGTYGYDYQGMRVRKQTASSTVRYVYDETSVLLQTDGSGTTVAKYDWGGDRLLALNHAVEGRQFYLFDALGSVANLTRPDGVLQASYKYDAWGKSRGGQGDSSNVFGFTGHELDDETGLYYAKARFYDVDIGRFLSEDPFEGDFLSPPSLHKYLYAIGRPTKYVDPDGQLFFLPLLAYAALTAIIATEASVIHQEITQGKDLSTVDYKRAGLTGLGAGGIVLSGGTLGVGATGALVGIGGAFSVGHQTLVEGRSLSDIDKEEVFQASGITAGVGALGALGLGAGGAVATTTKAAGLYLAAKGAEEGAHNIVEGIEEGNLGKAAFGAVEVGASALGARALANAPTGPKLVAEHPSNVSREPVQLELFDPPPGTPRLPEAPRLSSGSEAASARGGPVQLDLFPEGAPITGAAAELKPGQIASAYPKGRPVAGGRAGRLASDPPAGFREQGAFEWTPENVARMERGQPPIGTSGRPVQLHHRGQSPAGPLDELSSTTHEGVSHPVRPSQIDRSKFAGERSRYWVSRVREALGQ